MIIYTILFLIALVIIVFAFSKFKNLRDYNIILNILRFILFLVVYYILITIVTIIPLSIMSHGDNFGSGLWACSLILGMILAPILSLITTFKLNKKKKNMEILEQINGKKNIQEINKN